MSQLRNKFFDIDPNPEEFITPVTEAIYAGVMEDQNATRSNAINRPSSSGSCVRALWYQANNYPAQKMAGRSHINFMAGNIGEYTMLHFLKKYCVGEGKPFKQLICGEPIRTFMVGNEEVTQYKQIWTKTILPSGRELPGSIDFMVQYHDDTWAIGDCKTASEYGFKNIKASNDPENYKYQAHCYMASDVGLKHNVKKFLFVYMRKSTGHLHDFTINFDESLIKEIDEKFAIANGDIIPSRPYELEPETYYKKPTGRMIVPSFPCGYCGFAEHCFPGIKKDFKKDQFGNYKPTLVVEDKKEEIA